MDLKGLDEAINLSLIARDLRIGRTFVDRIEIPGNRLYPDT
jgi:hypothetical protein